MSKKHNAGGKGIIAMLSVAIATFKALIVANAEEASKDGDIVGRSFDVAMRDMPKLTQALSTFVFPPMIGDIMKQSAFAMMTASYKLDGYADVMVGLQSIVDGEREVPTTAYAVEQLLDELLPAHRGEDDTICCGMEFQQLATSPHFGAPSTVALLAEGKVAKAARHAQKLDRTAVMFAVTGGLIPVFHEDANDMAAIMLTEWAEQTADLKPAPVGQVKIEGSDDAAIVENLLKQASGQRQLPPSVS